jgi:3-hydroxyisobutyrate dehydrogenase
MKAGVIGLGAMGGPIAANLHKAGLLAAAWNRTPARALALARDTGAHIAADPAAVARACDVVIVSVSRDADLFEVIEAMTPGLHEGLIVVDTSTVSVGTVRAVAERVRGHGVDFLDAPVSGGVEGARQAKLAMMVGGDAAALERARPVLEAVAAKIVHMGPTGSGQATKAVNQIMAAGINQAVTEALAFGQAMGLDMDRVIEVVGSGAVANWYLSHRGPTMVKGVYEPGFKVALHHKDLEICQRMMAERGENRLPIVEMSLIHYKRLMDEGHGDEDISALYRIKKELFEEERGKD